MAEEPEARHQGRPRRPLLQRLGAIPAGQVVRAAADHLGRHGDGDRLCLDQGRTSTTRTTSRPTRSASTSGRPISLGEEDGIPKTPEWQEKETGVPAKDVRALAREWGEEARLSRARRLGQRPWRRLPQPDRHPVGARDGVPVGDAGARQARLQHGQSAMGLPARFQFLFPGLFRRRHVGRPRKHRDAGRALPAHAAASDHELQRPDASRASAMPEAIIDGKAEGYPLGRQVDRAPVRASSPIRRPAIRRCTCSTSTAARSSPP